MEEMTEQEALYILRNCYVMKTGHTLDEENIKLKQAIKEILKINKKRNQRNKELREKNKKIKQNYISKQIVETKIKEREESLINCDTYTSFSEADVVNNEIDTLKELL